jgi:predicted nucleotidyltransferase
MVKDKRIKEMITRMVEKIKREYQPEKIILFGSYAWGKPTKDSDVDLFIVKETQERHIDRSVRVAEILDEESWILAIEPWVYTPTEVSQRLKIGDPFIKKIIKKGKVLYG